MKICIINKHPKDFLGGSEIQTHNIATELSKKKFSIDYIAINGNKKIKTNYRIYNIKDSLNNILTQIDKVKPDIIYWRYNRNYLITLILFSKLKKIKFIYAASSIRDIKCFIKNETSFKKINFFRYLFNVIFRFYQNLFFGLIDSITTNNEIFLNYINHKKKIYIPNFISSKKKGYFKWKRKFIVWISNLKPVKNIDLMYETAEKFLNIDFLIIGKPLFEEYEKMQKYKKNIYYLGQKKVEVINCIISKALININTEFTGGFSNSFIQSCLQGKKTVSYYFNPGNMLKKYDFGECANGDKKLFFKLIKKNIQSGKMSNKRKNEIIKIAQKKFNKNHSINKLIYIFNKI